MLTLPFRSTIAQPLRIKIYPDNIHHSNSPFLENKLHCNRCIDNKIQSNGTKNSSDELGSPVANTTNLFKALMLASTYLKNQVLGKWRNQASLMAVALYFDDINYFSPGNRTGEKLALELTTELLAAHLRGISEISSSEIARYIHASLICCLNPHMVSSLVNILRQRVEAKSYSNPFNLLTLCNAKDTMTANDVVMLEILSEAPHHSSWIGTQALALMALACISKKSTLVNASVLKHMSNDLKNHIESKENLQTTALIAQALIAAGEKNWDKIKAFKKMVDSQSSDGSFGKLITTYYVLPALNNKSMLSISNDHCRSRHEENDISSWSHLKNHGFISVSYSLWITEKEVVVRNLDVTPVINATFLDVMNLAVSIDPTYRFLLTDRNNKPHVYAVSGIEDEPDSDKYWFLYKVVNNTMEMITSSPVDVFPADGEEYVFHYKTGDWAVDVPKTVA